MPPSSRGRMRISFFTDYPAITDTVCFNLYKEWDDAEIQADLKEHFKSMGMYSSLCVMIIEPFLIEIS